MAETVADLAERHFFSRTLRLELAEPIDPVTIDDLKGVQTAGQRRDTRP